MQYFTACLVILFCGIVSQINAAELPPYTVSSGAIWLSQFPRYEIPSLSIQIQGWIEYPDAQNLILSVVWAGVYCVIFFVMGLLTYLLMCICSCTQCCCKCMSSKEHKYSDFDRNCGRITLIIAATIIIAGCGFAIYNGYKLSKIIPDSLDQVKTFVNAEADDFNVIVNNIEEVGGRYGIVLPRAVYDARNQLNNARISADHWGDEPNKVSTYVIGGFSGAYAFLGLVAVLVVLFALTKKLPCVIIALILSFIALFLIVLITIPFVASSFALSTVCASNVRNTISALANKTIIERSSGNDTQCFYQTIEYLLYCKDFSRVDCNPFANLHQELTTRINQLNQTNPNDPDLQTLIDTDKLVVQTGDCGRSSNLYSNIVELKACWSATNYSSSILLVTVALHLALIATMFALLLTCYRLDETLYQETSASLTIISASPYSGSFYQQQPFTKFEDDAVPSNERSKVGIIVGSVLTIVLINFGLLAVFIGATVGSSPETPLGF